MSVHLSKCSEGAQGRTRKNNVGDLFVFNEAANAQACQAGWSAGDTLEGFTYFLI